jgi:DHA1 family multidrug resistance protein-like MFS transporter
MLELFRDTTFGRLLRIVTRNKILQFEDEKDPSIWKRYVDVEGSGHLAHHGSTEPPEEGQGSPERVTGDLHSHSDDEKEKDPEDSDGTRVPSGGENVNYASGVKVDGEKGKDIHLVSWYGENDPENPQNWSLFKKCFVTGLICLLTTSVYIGSSIYTPGIMNIMEIFGVSKVAATLGLTLFVAGYGIGPMLWAPMSEIPQIGRNPIYLGTLAVFVAFQAPTALASNFGMLLAFRFLTGFFGSPVLATGGASIGDIWSPKVRAYPITIWGIAAICGPVLGPLVGGYAVQFAPVADPITAPWAWPIWELMWLSAFCLVMLFFFFPETSANNILVRRAQRLRKVTGNDKLISQPELMSQEMTGKDIVMMSLVRPFTLNFTEPMVSCSLHFELPTVKLNADFHE